ncbi:MAG: dephospho-CoA kinase [Clostridia bacterium]|nr:dephospho-CoA kinase [Clostridia bacterium]
MTQNRVIGLTGGSGSGKSLAAEIFASLGACVIDADKISHEITDSDMEVLRKIREEFSEEVFENGKLSRKALGRIVFNDKNALGKLNSILHPAIAEKIADLVESCENSLIIIDAPLLFSVKEIVDLCTETVAVCAPEDVRINRIMARDGIEYKEALSRVRSQMSQEKLMEMADKVIANNGSVESLRSDIIDYLGE